MSAQHVLIIGISSDIGADMAERYAKDGYQISGTYRSETLLPRLKVIPNCVLYHCDLANAAGLQTFTDEYLASGANWDSLIFLPNTPLPIEPFFEGQFQEWESSLHLNAVSQLRLLHDLYVKRQPGKINNIVFFAAGGVNNAVVNFSAYSISKILLIKMCEYLDAENPDLNLFIVGPGWVKTKTHDLILANTSPGDPKHQQTLEFLQTRSGTDPRDIYEYVQWLCQNGKKVASGRNFSVAGDPWRESGEELATALATDSNLFKLRRHGNDFIKLKGMK